MKCPQCSFQPIKEFNYCTECGFSYLNYQQEQVESKSASQWQHVKIAVIFFCVYFISLHAVFIFPFFAKTFLGFNIAYWFALDMALTFFFIAGEEKLRNIFRFKILKSLVVIVGALIGFYIVSLLYKLLINQFFAFNFQTNSIKVGTNLTYYHLLYVCLLPAISEEIAFRSFIYEKFKLAIGRYDAIVLTSILFAMIHLQPLMFIFFFFSGIVLSWVKDSTNSVIPCILLHFFYNLAILFWAQQSFL